MKSSTASWTLDLWMSCRDGRRKIRCLLMRPLPGLAALEMKAGQKCRECRASQFAKGGSNQMPLFELRDPNGEVYEINAPDEQTAIKAFKQSAGNVSQA